MGPLAFDSTAQTVQFVLHQRLLPRNNQPVPIRNENISSLLSCDAELTTCCG